MKTCPYCGIGYPDDVAVCVTDGRALVGGNDSLQKVTGVWRGVYGFGTVQELAGMKTAAFTLKLKQGWTSHFTGSVAEDPPRGVPGIGVIEGYFSLPKIEFTKRMPVGYLARPDGVLVTLRDYIIAEGHPCEKDLPSPPIFYQGSVLDPNRVQGTWIINQHQITLADGSSISLPRSVGYWCAQFVSADAKIQPTGGPAESLFDKTLLSQQEIEEVDGVVYLGLGQFNVADTEKCLDRFFQEDIRFKLNQNDDAMEQTMPIVELTGGNAGTARLVEILVHPDDEKRASEIVAECIKIN